MNKTIPLKDINIDHTQTRASISEAVVEEYAEAMKAKAEFPSVTVFFDGTTNFLADGFHRFFAANTIGKKSLDAEVRNGTKTDALKYALGANVTHGMRRTNADKKKCVTIALKEFANLSDRQIAEMCGVSNNYVSEHRPQLSSDDSSAPAKRTGKDGKERVVKPKKEKAKKEKAEPEAFWGDDLPDDKPRVTQPTAAYDDCLTAVLDNISLLKTMDRWTEAKSKIMEVL